MSETFDKYRHLIRRELQKQVARLPSTLSQYLCYHFGWEYKKGKPAGYSSGKMVRPLFCLFSAEACGGKKSWALPAASSIELIHNFSLIHDDIEDASVERRHRLTLWKAFGLGPALNVGDVMFTLSYRALISPVLTKGLSDAQIVEAARILTDASIELCEGQNLDLLMEKKLDVEIDEYLYMIQHKTAALFRASTHLGAFLGGANQTHRGYFSDFGLNIGMAFQAKDDILGIWGEKEKTGKSISDDILGKKKTLPVIFALAKEKERGLKKLRNIYSSEKIQPEQVSQIVELLDKYEAKQYCLSRVDSFYEESLSSLKATGVGNPLLKNLEKLSKLSLGREEE